MGKIFNEQSLRQAIIDKWGEYGAHCEVFDELLKRALPSKPEKEFGIITMSFNINHTIENNVELLRIALRKKGSFWASELLGVPSEYLEKSPAPTPVSSEEGKEVSQDTLDNEKLIAFLSIECGLLDYRWDEGLRGMDRVISFLRSRLTPSTPQGEVEQAAKEYGSTNHPNNSMCRNAATKAFKAGASWQSLSSESSGAVELWDEIEKKYHVEINQPSGGFIFRQLKNYYKIFKK